MRWKLAAQPIITFVHVKQNCPWHNVNGEIIHKIILGYIFMLMHMVVIRYFHIPSLIGQSLLSYFFSEIIKILTHTGFDIDMR